MIEIYVNPLTRVINGYNKVVNDENVDNVTTFLVSNEMLGTLEHMREMPLFYVDGKVTSHNDNEDAKMEQDIKDLNSKIHAAENKVRNEHEMFMSNVLSGKTQDEAARISRENREEYEKLLKEKEELVEKKKVKTALKIEKILEEKIHEPDVFKHFLSIVAVVRDENDYLEEWMRYHIEEIGVDHFYIYDNESAVPVKEFLESVGFKYMDKVTIEPWPTTSYVQADSYNDFLKRYGAETRWFSAMDPDEYIVIKDKSKSLKEFLNENHMYSSIACPWVHFNANGQVHKEPGTDMERFTKAVDWGTGGKKIARTSRVRCFTSYLPDIPLSYPYTQLSFSDKKVTDYFQLNHYYTRSYDEFMGKLKRGSSNPNFRRKITDFFELNPDLRYLDTGEIIEQGYGSAAGNK